MKKFILGGLAAAAVITPVAATAGSASAATIVSTDPACSPVKEAPAVTHIEYKYVPVKSGTGSTHWATTGSLLSIKVNGIDYVRDGNKTRIVTDVPAVEGVTCSVTLPQFADEGGSVTVPFTEHVDTFLYGVHGHPETEAITGDVTVTNMDVSQFWLGYVVHEGYAASNAGTTHIDFGGLRATDVDANGYGYVSNADGSLTADAVFTNTYDMVIDNEIQYGKYAGFSGGQIVWAEVGTYHKINTTPVTQTVNATPVIGLGNRVVGFNLTGFGAPQYGAVTTVKIGDVPAGASEIKTLSQSSNITPSVLKVNGAAV